MMLTRIGGLVAGVVEDVDGVDVLDLVRQASVLEARGETLEDRRRIWAGGSGRPVDLDRLRIRRCLQVSVAVPSSQSNPTFERVGGVESYLNDGDVPPARFPALSVHVPLTVVPLVSGPGVVRYAARPDAGASVGAVKRDVDGVVVPTVAVRRTVERHAVDGRRRRVVVHRGTGTAAVAGVVRAARGHRPAPADRAGVAGSDAREVVTPGCMEVDRMVVPAVRSPGHERETARPRPAVSRRT